MKADPQRLVAFAHKITPRGISLPALWSITEKKNTEWIAIQSFTLPRAMEWGKWASEQTSERSRVREQSEECGASEQVSGKRKRANGRASGPVLQSVFLVVVAHSRMDRHTHGQTDTKFYEKRENESIAWGPKYFCIGAASAHKEGKTKRLALKIVIV